MSVHPNRIDTDTNPVPIPRTLAEFAAQPDEKEWRDWIARLPALLADVRARWGLDVGAPYEPGGMCSWVAPARTASGDQVVLKLGIRHDESEHEIDGLRFWDGDGTARLYDAFTTDDTAVLLLERCLPGFSLKKELPEPKQDEIIARLLRRLWREPPTGHLFRPLQSMCDDWGDSLERKIEQYPDSLDGGLARTGLEIFRGYAASTHRHVLLCTDLHGDNVLAAQREPWLVIDPKPYVGDPAYDAVQHLLNGPGRLESDPRGLCQRMAHLLDVDAERIAHWLLARCVQEAYSSGDWGRQLGAVAHLLAP